MTRGQIAAEKGEVPASERWFDEAVRLAPSLADAHLAWGRALLERKDRRGAAEQFALAARKAPRWADPPKYWGGVLKVWGGGRAAPALGIVAWGQALEAQGRRDEARAKYRAAAEMYLTAAHRAEVARRLSAR